MITKDFEERLRNKYKDISLIDYLLQFNVDEVINTEFIFSASINITEGLINLIPEIPTYTSNEELKQMKSITENISDYISTGF